jgi:hypothetical protein
MKTAFVRSILPLCTVLAINTGAWAAAPVDAEGRPLIQKLGTIDVDKVETTPVVFHGKLYRFEWFRKKGYFHFVEHDSGQTTPPFAQGWNFGSAFVDGDTMYVTGTQQQAESLEVHLFVSKDLAAWTEHTTGVGFPGKKVWNTSICKSGDEFVLAFEYNGPRGIGPDWTTRFATSKDMVHWSIMPEECAYRHGAPCLRHLDGWYYLFYLKQVQNIPPGAKPPVKFKFEDLSWEQCVTRSKDLMHWEESPLNPMMRASDDDRKIANPNLTQAQRERAATARNVNNSDLDFCEHQGRLILDYSWGDQHGIEQLAEAVYEGSEADFLRGWFPEPKRPAQSPAKPGAVKPGP